MSGARRIFLTGGAGYIGGRLMRRLLADGCRVLLCLRKKGDASKLGLSDPGLSIISDDMEEEAALTRLKDHSPDIGVHLATYYRKNLEYADIDDLVASNIAFPSRWAVRLAAAGCQAFINTGTYWQGSDREPHRPINLYAATKAAFQSFLDTFVQQRAMTVVTLKLFDVYGPDDPRPKIFSLIKEAARNAEKLALSPGGQRLYFTHVNDVVEAYICVIENLKSLSGDQHHVFDVAAQSSTLKEAAELFNALLGGGAKLVWGARDYAPGQIMTPRAERRPPGWSSRYSLKAGLETLLD